METLQIILTILSSLTYAVTTTFAIMAWFRLRQVQKDIDLMERRTHQMYVMSMASHIQRNFEEVQHMKEVLEELIESENFEEAEKLQAAINEAEESAMRSLKNFKEIAGDSIREVIVTNKKRED